MTAGRGALGWLAPPLLPPAVACLSNPTGVHVNGFVTLPDGSQELWVARRSATKPTWPGKLDHIAAGGQPHGLRCVMLA